MSYYTYTRPMSRTLVRLRARTLTQSFSVSVSEGQYMKLKRKLVKVTSRP
jgi:hypothetical protein